MVVSGPSHAPSALYLEDATSFEALHINQTQMTVAHSNSRIFAMHVLEKRTFASFFLPCFIISIKHFDSPGAKIVFIFAGCS